MKHCVGYERRRRRIDGIEDWEPVNHPSDGAAAFDRRLGRFFDPCGVPFDGHPPYMDPDEFDCWGFRYVPSAVEWAESERNLKVLRSAWFGEWLQSKGAAINGLFLCSQSCIGMVAEVRVSAETACFSALSTGKYKSMKIGFRLVYEVDAEA